MLKYLLLSSILLVSQSTESDRNFIDLQNKLEDYGFVVNIAIPPDYQLPQQGSNFPRRRVRKPYGVLHAPSKSIWINPVVFELGISQSVLIHETIHAAQFCQGNSNLEPLELDIEPIKQAQPFFKRYANIHNQTLEKEAFAVQTQTNSYELAVSLLDKHCQ